MKLYKVLPDTNYEIHTGIGNENKQFLVGLIKASVIVLQFSEEGDFESFHKGKRLETPTKKTYFPLISEHLEKHMIKIQPIVIKKFQIDEVGISISDVPKFLEHYQMDQDNIDPSEAKKIEEEWEEWLDPSNTNFVLNWGTIDLWLNDEGLIIGT